MAGYNATRYVITQSLPPLHLKNAPENPVPCLPSIRGKFRGLRQRIREVAWNYGGIVRTGAGLQEGLHKIEEMARQLGKTARQTIADKILKEDTTLLSITKKYLTRKVFLGENITEPLETGLGRSERPERAMSMSEQSEFGHFSKQAL
jgi:aspartate oxidase